MGRELPVQCGCGRGSPFSSRLLAQAELCATPAEPAARAQHFRGTVSDFRVAEIIPTSVLMGLLLGLGLGLSQQAEMQRGAGRA